MNDRKVNIKAVMSETGLTLEQLAELAEMRNSKAIYKWAYDREKNGIRPTYETLAKLLEAGASVESLFGVNYKAGEKIIEKELTPDDFMRGLKKALADLGKS
ncbi:hypothetical protein SAMN02745108_02823 [Fibrobacter intestinalis]|uniref:Uncharacterized protein n=1 Tax=Fibrobacter intestinalis TaxID=28122 RepID=A0A1T4RS56_9BACT|nr:hypothetical protein BGW94_3016 [Fibrobacter sp. NR9]SKA18773.1 hypothetical protein SAMN02745108_02823 [Fibrobacter intestinalis]